MTAELGAFSFERSQDGDTVAVRIVGTIDEHADLSFMQDLHGRVRLNLAELRRINSFGVRTWRDSIHQVPGDAYIELLECPTPFIDQVNMLADFIGAARVVSFRAPYVCEECDHETDELLEAEACRQAGALPDAPVCPNCNVELSPDFLEDMYLSFLKVDP